ncbi:efflux RND transporter periplasmic adaptor subunit [Parahaliea maris]|uniref:Efflux RND transporter periplasmic adaptor subunit n=1 Tax=Parahaliea maris TaxID=2716870 RepID=A0A5C8ZUH1_9GAMM|nr:efflux RND transporter periplasmic adaptor subunit [Parahaliea maris]TXS92138.1 efflux RND transporter periplasmic adaptor subunit [Parahaliea maris]
MALTKKQLSLSFLMLGSAVAVTYLLYLGRPSTKIAEPVYVPVTVDVAEAVMETIRIPVQAQGTVTPLRRTDLIAEVAGRVIEVSDTFNVGGFVAEGEVLLRIDPRDYQTALLRAQSAVASAESALAQEKGRAQVAEQEWKKLPAGSQRSPEAKALYLRKPQLEQAEAQLLAAQADLSTARDNLGRSVIRAPYAALISGKSVELGQYVSPGSPLAEVFSIGVAEVRLPIPQGKLEYLELPELGNNNRAAPIDLYTDIGGNVTHWPATLQRSEGVFDERSRVLYAVARVEDPYALEHPERTPLRIGTFVNANIKGRALPDLIALPRHVLRAGNQVWVVDSQQRLRDRKISILRTGGDLVYVSDGLEAGELVSLTSLDPSLTGSEVKVVSRRGSDIIRLEYQAEPAAASKAVGRKETPAPPTDASQATASTAGREA